MTLELNVSERQAHDARWRDAGEHERAGLLDREELGHAPQTTRGQLRRALSVPDPSAKKGAALGVSRGMTACRNSRAASSGSSGICNSIDRSRTRLNREIRRR